MKPNTTDNKTNEIIVSNLPIPQGYTVKDGNLHLNGFDLAAMADYWLNHAGQEDAPLTIRFMSRIRNNVERLHDAFARASQQTGYPGEIRLALASKANPNEPVIRTALSAGADYECSSRNDAWIIRHAIENEWLKPEQWIIANGFKTAAYSTELIKLVSEGHPNVVPIFDAASEIAHFADSSVQMKVGFRYRITGRNDRFGMDRNEILEASQLVADAPNLSLAAFHAIQRYPAVDSPEQLGILRNAIEMYRELWQKHPSLAWFDIGGGIPTELVEADDLQEYMVAVQQLILDACKGMPVPGLIIESGRFLAGSHELKVFRVERVKVVDGMPYYVISGSIMTNLPDSWALGIEFPVTALNYLDTPHQNGKLAGLTCDPDDIYPPFEEKVLSLPTETDGLLIGFLNVGAYQDILGGEGGANHCLISEGATILIGDDPEQPKRVSYRPPVATETILHNLGYDQSDYSAF